MKNIHILYCFLLMILGSKCKEEVATPLPITKNKTWVLDTIWKSYIGGFSNNPILNSNNDILMSKVFDNPQGEVFKLYDGKTGKLKWEWADYLRPEEAFLDIKHVVIDDIIVLCARSYTYAFNIVTGQTVWKHEMPILYGEPQICNDDDGYIYQGYFNDDRNFMSIYRTKYNEGKWELVCTYNDTFSYSKLGAPSIGVTNNLKGEKMVIFTLYFNYSENGNNKVKSKICGFNTVSKKFDWIKDYSDTYSEFWNCKMTAASNKVFAFASYRDKWKFVAFNVSDGSIAWDKELPNAGVGMHLYKDNIITLCNGSSAVQCFNINTGTLVWERPFPYVNDASYPNINFDFGDALVFKNYLLSTQCDNLLVLNLDNGAVIFNKEVALPNGCLQYGVAINEQKRWFYVQDRNNVICYKLPEEVKY